MVSSKWRWTMLALIPGLVSDLFFVAVLLLSTNATNSDIVAGLGMGMLYAALFTPLIAPFYLYFVGRGYVRAMHGGFTSAFPFVLLYSIANLVLWACGVALVGSQIKWA